jgi:DNA-3-methyladenine glycosylase II
VTATRIKTLATEKELTAAVRALARQCHVMQQILARTGTPPLRDIPPDFKGLARIVTGQQLSAQSANAIWTRVAAALVPFEPLIVVRSPDATLAALGLSSAKIKTLKGIAGAISAGQLDFDALNRMRDPDIVARLITLSGVGPWTAEIYLLFALRRADAFPSGDLALQLAVERLFALDTRPTAKTLVEIAERWRPWRGAAARLLWADYALQRETAITPARTTKRPPRKSSEA